MLTLRRLPWLSLAVCISALLLQLTDGASRGLFLHRTSPTDHGHFWTPWSTALVHVNWAHLRVNLVAALIAFSWLELRSCSRLVLVLLFATPVCTLLSCALHPELASYCGLSGVLHAAAAALVVDLALAGERRLACLLGVPLAAKLLWEAAGGGSLVLGASSGCLVVVGTAHLVGAFAGIVLTLLSALALRLRSGVPLFTQPQ